MTRKEQQSRDQHQPNTKDVEKTLKQKRVRPGSGTFHEWFPGLSPMHKEELSRIIEEGFERRKRKRRRRDNV